MWALCEAQPHSSPVALPSNHHAPPTQTHSSLNVSPPNTTAPPPSPKPPPPPPPPPAAPPPARPPPRLFLCGLAYDFCVRYSAIDGHNLGFETIVIEDATRPVNLP